MIRFTLPFTWDADYTEPARLVSSPEGEWVRYEDVEAEVDRRVTEKLAALGLEISNDEG